MLHGSAIHFLVRWRMEASAHVECHKKLAAGAPFRVCVFLPSIAVSLRHLPLTATGGHLRVRDEDEHKQVLKLLIKAPVELTLHTLKSQVGSLKKECMMFFLTLILL
jgi:hypothetical protein